MVGKVLDIEDILTEDRLACEISNNFIEWEIHRNNKAAEWQEISQYVLATDTTKTSNSTNPWSNKTTIPKLCQIRDNLYANYMAAMFPKRKWLIWEGATEADEEISKKEAIESYMQWVTNRNEYYEEAGKLVLDYIDYGNCFMTVDWIDQRDKDRIESVVGGYVGPVLRRISPLDIVFNPTAPSFKESPKIIRSFMSIGEVKEMMERMTNSEDDAEYYANLYKYMKDTRGKATRWDGSINQKNNIYSISGFGSFTDYLESNTVEILTFYGDIYDEDSDTFKRNRVIKVIDRHKVLCDEPHPAALGHAPIYHVGWRTRPDNLWAMGPLDNLVGMQYRIDHVENIKADLIDITAMPPLKIRGFVEEFTWGPMERIIVGDNGDVEMMIPNANALQYNTEIAVLEQRMEEMAGAPKEAMGFRTPGEKTKYEVQRIENAASRIFQNKTAMIEMMGFENAINAMLEMARRRLDEVSIRIFDTEAKVADFRTVTVGDIQGTGRLKPIAARHFAEKAEMLQNLSNFFQSAVGADQEVRSHFSSIKIARLMEELLDITEYDIVEPFVRISEQQELQRMANVAEENLQMEIAQPSGITEDDFEPELI